MHGVEGRKLSIDPYEYRKKAKKIFFSPEVNFDNYLRNEEHELLALRFFDVTNLEDNKNLTEREKILIEIQNEVLHDPLELSLQKYSSGIVLGALINAVKRFEGDLQHHEKYSQATERVEHWNSLYISPELKPYLQDALFRIWEIRDWLQTKATQYFPLVEKIIQNYFQSEKKPTVVTILHSLQKEETDREIFFLISSLLKSNPLLHEMLTIRCDGLFEDSEPIIHLFLDTLSLLAEKTTDQEVKGISRLFLAMYKNELEPH